MEQTVTELGYLVGKTVLIIGATVLGIYWIWYYASNWREEK